MPWFKRRPRITDQIYGDLMTSFGRIVDLDVMVRGPAEALAARVTAEQPAFVQALDAGTYQGSTAYHLRLLAGAWIMAAEGSVPRATAEAFEMTLAWKFGPLVSGSEILPARLSSLARGDAPRES